MRSLHEGEESGRIVDVHAGAEAVPGYGREFYRFARWFGRAPRERMSQSIFNQLRQRLTGLMGKAFGRSEKLVIEANRGPHMSEHMLMTSICQLGIGLTAVRGKWCRPTLRLPSM